MYKLHEEVTLEGKLMRVVGVDENHAVLDEWDPVEKVFTGYSTTVSNVQEG